MGEARLQTFVNRLWYNLGEEFCLGCNDDTPEAQRKRAVRTNPTRQTVGLYCTDKYGAPFVWLE